jgi:hypothetical protein
MERISCRGGARLGKGRVSAQAGWAGENVRRLGISSPDSRDNRPNVGEKQTPSAVARGSVQVTKTVMVSVVVDVY